MRLGLIASIAGGVLFLSIAAGAAAKDQKYEVTDKDKVYYGDCASFEAPATVVIDEVFPYIHAYRLIGERKLQENDPEYWVLLLKANEVFRNIVKQVAVASKHDLVAERGVIKATEAGAAIGDITHLVVAEVKREREDD